MILIDFFRIWLLLDFVAAMTPISLEMNNTLTNCDTGDVEIRCAVDGNLMAEIVSISLIRHEEIVAIVSGDGESKITELTNRSGVSVQSLISNISSYLNIKIIGSVFEPTKDKGPYKCCLKGLSAEKGLFSENTSLVMLNITESNLECSQPTIEIQLRDSASTMETQSSKNINADADEIINIGMYRELTVVTGVVICCILLLIMVREIRIHYCTSEDIVYV